MVKSRRRIVDVLKMSSVFPSESKILKDVSVKLGVSNHVLRKGSELSRLLQLKTATNSKSMQQISDSCRHIICLDLAASSLGVSFERDIAIGLSGVKKKLYMNGYHMFEKVLGLEQNVTIKNLCIQLGCSEVIELAEDVLKRYVDGHSKGLNKNKHLDIHHPMYAAFAVYCACRHKKIKASKKSLVEISRVKSTSFDKMALEMSSVLTSMETEKTAKKRKATTLLDLVEQNIKDTENAKRKSQGVENCDEDNSPKVDDYETWKRKMLEEAKEAES